MLLPLFARLRNRGLLYAVVCSWLAFGLLLAGLALAGLPEGIGEPMVVARLRALQPAVINLPDFAAGVALGLLFVRTNHGRNVAHRVGSVRAASTPRSGATGRSAWRGSFSGTAWLSVESDVVDTLAPLVLPCWRR